MFFDLTKTIANSMAYVSVVTDHVPPRTVDGLTKTQGDSRSDSVATNSPSITWSSSASPAARSRPFTARRWESGTARSAELAVNNGRRRLRAEAQDVRRTNR